MDKIEVAIIGAGAAGLAAAGKLIASGANVVVLEASSRIGGRIHSEKFGDSYVNIGANWVGGEPIYSLAKEEDLIIDVRAFSHMHYVLADGQIVEGQRSREIASKVKQFADDCEALKAFNGSLGDYFAKRFEVVSKDLNFDARNLDGIVSSVQRFKCLEHGCDDLCHASTATLTQRGPRTKCAVAKSGGFVSLLPLLLEKHCVGRNLDDVVKLECEVKNIDYSNPNKITLITSKDEVKCDLVLVTLPLNVLKTDHPTLFYPSLPSINIEAMKNLEMGTVDKIYLKFPKRWWPAEQFSGFCFATQPDQDGGEWENSLIAVIADESAPLVLCGWIVGDCARRMENCSDEEVVERVTRILREKLGGHYEVPTPDAVLRSKWHSDPKFRGSYTHYKNSCEDTDATEKLCTPVANANGKPVVFFAGEATSKRDFSTAHGAVESGWREARRIIDIYSKPDGYHKIVIVGAGLAGLAAAKTFVSRGIDDFKILEAQDYAGGRVMTEQVQNGVIELGAQWAHVSNSRMVEVAKEFDLASPLESSEGSGAYFYPGGLQIPVVLVEEIQTVVSNILENCVAFYTAVKDENIPATVGEFLDNEFEKYMKSCDDSEEDDKLKRALFDWHIRFQVIDNSCDRLSNLSARLWGQFGDLGAEQEHINFVGGFSRLVSSLVRLLPARALVTSCPVSRVVWGKNRCRILCTDGQQFQADHAIITNSIGFLKDNRNFFEPPLPKKYRNAIENIGFGTINKIFLFYDDRWWGDLQGIQLVWNSRDQFTSAKFASGQMSWVKGLTGFDTVTSCENVLLGWVGGQGAKECENLSDSEIGSHCTTVLRHFTGRLTVPTPIRVIRSKWNSNKFVRGAYSHLAFSSDGCQEILSEPLITIDHRGHPCPSLFFAGEALHKKYYSTANGAFDCGEAQANRLLQYLDPPADQ